MLATIDMQQDARQGTPGPPLAMPVALASVFHEPGSQLRNAARLDRNTYPDRAPAPSLPWQPLPAWARAFPRRRSNSPQEAKLFVALSPSPHRPVADPHNLGRLPPRKLLPQLPAK